MAEQPDTDEQEDPPPVVDSADEERAQRAEINATEGGRTATHSTYRGR